MSRTERIERKVSYITNLIEKAQGDIKPWEKLDFALDLVKEISGTSNKAALDECLDDFINEARHTIIRHFETLRRLVNPEKIEWLKLVPNIHVKPVVEVKQGENFFYFPLVDGGDWWFCKDFLRSLDVDVDIHFENYSECAILLEKINNVLREREKKSLLQTARF